MKKWVTIPEAERITGIPDPTIRKYIKSHGHFFKIHMEGRVYYISRETLPVVQRVQEMYQSGYSMDRIEAMLSKTRSIPLSVIDHGVPRDLDLKQVIEEFREHMNQTNTLIQDMMEEQKRTRRRMEELKQEIQRMQTVDEERAGQQERRLDQELRHIQQGLPRLEQEMQRLHQVGEEQHDHRNRRMAHELSQLRQDLSRVEAQLDRRGILSVFRRKKDR